MFDAYVGVMARDSPGPVTEPVHGVCAEPVYMTDAGHVTLATVVAAAIWNVAEPLLPE